MIVDFVGRLTVSISLSDDFLSLCLLDCKIHNIFESKIALNPGLGGVRDLASAIVSHEQTQ